MVVEGVQHQLNRVIIEHVFPPREPGTNLVRLIVEADENRVEIPVVIPKIGLGRLRHGFTVAGNALNKAVYLGQFSVPSRAGFHLEKVFELGNTADSWDDDLSKIRRRCRPQRGREAEGDERCPITEILPQLRHARLRVSPVWLL
jgi:hypothetical protein